VFELTPASSEVAVLRKPFWPSTEQVVASVLDQVRAVEPPLRTRVGLAWSETVGQHMETGGVITLQVPLHCTIPTSVFPQMLASDVQKLPKPAGDGGVVPEHEPSHCTVPLVIWPHTLALDVQELPRLATQLPVTTTPVHEPQLSFSFDSVITPEFPAELLSAQMRM